MFKKFSHSKESLMCIMQQRYMDACQYDGRPSGGPNLHDRTKCDSTACCDWPVLLS